MNFYLKLLPFFLMSSIMITSCYYLFSDLLTIFRGLFGFIVIFISYLIYAAKILNGENFKHIVWSIIIAKFLGFVLYMIVFMIFNSKMETYTCNNCVKSKEDKLNLYFANQSRNYYLVLGEDDFGDFKYMFNKTSELDDYRNLKFSQWQNGGITTSHKSDIAQIYSTHFTLTRYYGYVMGFKPGNFNLSYIDKYILSGFLFFLDVFVLNWLSIILGIIPFLLTSKIGIIKLFKDY